jgi:DNA polymerase bacteriophage-type
MLKKLSDAELENALKNSTAHTLYRDYELRGRFRLNVVGAHQYCVNPSTEILSAAYAVDQGPVKLWVPGGDDSIPPEFIEAARDPAWLVVAHNDQFESQVERHILAPRHNWPIIPISKHRCTMAMALAAGLPGRLDKLADALELAHCKDTAGQRLMMQMARPRKPRQGEDQTGMYWFDDESRRKRLQSYNVQDVQIEREVYARLLPLSPQEQKLWELDACINDRGFHVDIALARAAHQVALAAGPEINAELAAVTEGTVTSVNQIAKLQGWLQQHGCPACSLDKKTIEALLDEDNELPPTVRRVLQLRLDGGQAAARKLNTLLATVGDDQRVRGAFKFHAAATGRFGGSHFQPQNLKKSKLEDVEVAIAAISTGSYEHVRTLYGQPLSVIGDISRSLICAAPEHRLIGADFSSIESRILAWVAGEHWKLDSYRRFDATHDPGDEPYRAVAGKIFHIQPSSITKEQRSIGKVCDLAFGYMGGINAWRKFEPDRFPDEEVKTFNAEWRAAHPAIKRFWYDVDRAALTAVRERGRVVRCGPIAFKNTGAFLLLKLPSGRKLSYPQPRAVGDEKRQSVVFADNAAGRFCECRNGQGAYGGLWTENVVSGIARDLLAEAMLRIEAAGYPIVLHVHDEIVCEVPERFGSTEEFTHLMTRKPAWALDLPIAAKAWTGKRYTK